MGASRVRGEKPGGSETRTLGDVLYGDKTRTRMPEKEWADLVRSIAGGDQKALHALFSRTHRIVFTVVMRITSNHETAEEVTLDVFHDVWRRASVYDPAGGPVVGWIMNQARSRAIDRLRYEQRKKRVGVPGDGAPRDEAPASRPDEAFAVAEQGRRLHQALETLPSSERQAIETAFFAELTYGEAAARLNQPVGTVKTRIRSGLRRLREALTGEGAEA